jgi:hypothetical protein
MNDADAAYPHVFICDTYVPATIPTPAQIAEMALLARRSQLRRH